MLWFARPRAEVMQEITRHLVAIASASRGHRKPPDDAMRWIAEGVRRAPLDIAERGEASPEDVAMLAFAAHAPGIEHAARC